MSKIILGFSKPRGFFKPAAWLIRKWQRTDFSHVYIRIPRPSGVDVIYQASGSAVNFMGMKVFGSHAIVLREFVFELSDESKNEFFDWAIEHAGEPYSVLKGIGIGLARCFNLEKNPFSDQPGFVCSTLAAFALQELKELSIAKVKPDDITKMGPKEVYELCEKVKL